MDANTSRSSGPLPTSSARYARWDGTQLLEGLSADEIMNAMSDDLLHDGDLQRAMQRLFRWGFQRPDGTQVPGLRDLMERVREQRREELSRYNLGSVLDDVAQRLDQVVETERSGIQQRLDEARGETRDESIDYADRPAPGGAPLQDQDAPGTGAEPTSQDEADTAALRDLLEEIAAQRLAQLDELSSDPADAIRALQNYDFLVPEARKQFDELLASIQQHMMQQAFDGMEQSLSSMSQEDIASTRQMLQELNEMLERDQRGEPTGFDEFMHRWGQHFDPDLRDVDDLRQHLAQRFGAMQQLMQSLSSEQRDRLQDLANAAIADDSVREEMGRLGRNLRQGGGAKGEATPYRFGGEESISLEQAMQLMERLQRLDSLEAALRDVRDWNDLGKIDQSELADLLGEQELGEAQQLRDMARVLEDAGLIRTNRGSMELTPRGARKIGEKALTDIFSQLKRDRVGQHDQRREGHVGERLETTKPYEWGDPFLLDIPKTLKNAVARREHVEDRLVLRPEDFEVSRTEATTRVSTVLMVDMSRSMLYNGCFHAAKKVALALDALIRGKYPRDHLSIVGFSYLAHEIKPADLPSLDWNEYNYGTNLQHGLQLARQVLGREKGSNRQIIVITDGEPTAHIDDGQVRFSYPPTARTFEETLREVKRCTRDGITINTFMLERSPYMLQFVNDMTRVNGGRVFVATPDRLGEYILVDYVANKRKWVG